MIYFAWVSASDTPFDPVAHGVEDEEVIGLDVSQEEGAFAVASVEVVNPGLGLLNGSRKRHALLSHRGPDDLEPTLLFRGRLNGFPRDIQTEFITIELVAEPDDSADRLAAICSTLKAAPHWDPLFVDESGEDDPSETLDARPSHFHWDRATHEVTLSDVLVGEELLDLGGEFFRDSLSVSLTEPPISRLDVTLKCEWEQKAEGLCDIGPRLRSVLSDSFFNVRTYTPGDFEQNLPRKGMSLGASGWEVHSADISRYTTGVKTIGSYSFTSYGGMTPAYHVYRCALGWTSYHIGQVQLRYDYSQKRTETARFTLTQDHQPLVSELGRSETLELTLQDITKDGATPLWEPDTAYAAGDVVRYGARTFVCTKSHTSGDHFRTWQFYEGEVDPDEGGGFDNGWRETWRRKVEDASALGRPDRDRFLDTDRGLKVIEHAILVGRARMRASLRAIEIGFTGRWDELADITLRHSVRIVDRRLPGGEATGKVVRYSMSIAGDQAPTVSVTIGVAVGTAGSAPMADDGLGDFVEDGYAEAGWQSAAGAEAAGADGIVYSISAPDPIRRVHTSDLSRHSYAVTRCELHGGIGWQEQEARWEFDRQFGMGAAMDAEAYAGVAGAINDRISDVPTRFVLQMRSLAAEDSLNREIAVSVKPMATPKGIDLTI